MRATEFIRNLLDFIDDQNDKNQAEIGSEDEVSIDCGCSPECDCADCQNNLANSPNPVFATVDMVTKDAGGGVNGPKHPADLKTSTFPLYPNLQYRGD